MCVVGFLFLFFFSCWVHCWEKVCNFFSLTCTPKRDAVPRSPTGNIPKRSRLTWARNANGPFSARDQWLRFKPKVGRGGGEAAPSVFLATRSNPPRAPRAGPLGRALLETRPLQEAVSLGPFTSFVVSALCLDVEKSTSENNQACSCWEAC